MEKNNPFERNQARRGKEEDLGYGIYQKEVGVEPGLATHHIKRRET